MSEPRKDESLSESFRRSRLEFWTMVGCWFAFAAWTIGYNALFAFDGAKSAADPVWGMPRWVVFGILIPWILGLALTIWFALRFMHDTPLDPEDFE